MKGIILAGGRGTRLHPLTLSVSKQLLPVHDKPMIYYPLSVLMLANIRDILIISTPHDLGAFQDLLGDGSRLGINLTYAPQTEPRGIAEALIIGADHIGADDVALILGDNIFHGPGFGEVLQHHVRDLSGCVLFGYRVPDPERYGVARADDRGQIVSLEEKPARPRSNMAVTGLYLYENDVVEIARKLRPSARGELEITDVNQVYVERRSAVLVDLGRGFAWLDTGTHNSLTDASHYMQLMEQRQGIRVACIEEVALNMGFIDAGACHRLGEKLGSSGYGQYVMRIAAQTPQLLTATP
ncbi:glucose-1-phosphate thymidylyltransferase RfbA [Streptomyces rubiginosohelvolus]|uniref:glucose-1-phosphate thymidylyltransferase RfbA n=1 Tax=Streptomyces rubiginosohelvolus TaxID=67362 RepID=UPI0035DBF1B5